MYVRFNPNPENLQTGDCVIRALSKLLDKTWDQVYVDLSLQGFGMSRMMSDNSVHQSYLRQYGYYIHPIPNSCPDCITVREFSKMFPKGKYILATGDHVVALIDGDYFDSFDSGDEIVSYVFSKGD